MSSYKIHYVGSMENEGGDNKCIIRVKCCVLPVECKWEATDKPETNIVSRKKNRLLNIQILCGGRRPKHS